MPCFVNFSIALGRLIGNAALARSVDTDAFLLSSTLMLSNLRINDYTNEGSHIFCQILNNTAFILRFEKNRHDSEGCLMLGQLIDSMYGQLLMERCSKIHVLD